MYAGAKNVQEMREVNATHFEMFHTQTCHSVCWRMNVSTCRWYGQNSGELWCRCCSLFLRCEFRRIETEPNVASSLLCCCFSRYISDSCKQCITIRSWSCVHEMPATVCLYLNSTSVLSEGAKEEKKERTTETELETNITKRNGVAWKCDRDRSRWVVW